MAVIIGRMEPADGVQRFDFAQLERELLDEGWSHGAPEPSWFVRHDRSMVESSVCERCFGALTFVPFVWERAYRAFAVCRRCNTGSEF